MDQQPSTSTDQKPDEKEASSPPERRDNVYLVPYPSFIFLYPTFFLSLVSAVILWWMEAYTVGPKDQVPLVLTSLFLGVFAINLVVLVFDFPRTNSLIVFFVLSTLALALWLMLTLKPDLLPAIIETISVVRPVANATFFGCFATMMGLLYVLIFISIQFNYWELRENELLHHHGLLSDLKRYPAPNLRVDKEIKDVFEYLLLRSGRLVIHPASEKRAIVLENILFVTKKEKLLTQMLSSIGVRIRKDD